MKTYLYRCFDRDNQLLYVGITDDWEKRRKQHAKEKFWWPDVARTTTMAFETRKAALWAEWAVITTCHPVYNKAAVMPSIPDMPPPELFEEDQFSQRGAGFTAALGSTVSRAGAALQRLATSEERVERPRRTLWTAVRAVLLRIWYAEFAWPPEEAAPKVATSIRLPEGYELSPNGRPQRIDGTDRPVRVPAPPPIPRPALTLAVLEREEQAVDIDARQLAAGKALVLRVIQEAGFFGVPPGTVQACLKGESIDIDLETVRDWIGELVAAGKVTPTAWDTFKVAPRRDGRAEPDDPAPVTAG